MAITGIDVDVPLLSDGIAAAIPPGSIKVANESPYALQIGLGGLVDWLPAWTVDVFAVEGVTSMHVHPVLTGTSQPPQTPSSQLLITTAAPYESFSGTYPAALNRQAASLNVSQLVGTIANVGGGDVVSKTFALPAGAQGCGFASSQAGTNLVPAKVTVTGSVTGLIYVDSEAPAGSQLVIMNAWAAEIFPEDTALVCSVTSQSVASPCLTYFHAYLYNPRMRVVGTNNATPVYVRNAATQPAPWQAATNRPVAFGGAIAAGVANRQQVIAGVANLTISLRAVHVTLSALVAGTLFLVDGDPNTGGTTIGSVAMAQANPGPIPLDGSPLSPGNGFFVYVDTANTIRGTAAFSQA